MRIEEVTVHQISLPLVKPYKVSFRTYTELEPILVQITGASGETGWGEAYIPAGSTRETAETGWQFCLEWSRRVLHRNAAEAKSMIDACAPSAPFAATAMLTALDMLERHPALVMTSEHRVPLLVPVSATSADAIRSEVDALLGQGYRTLKVKVGWDVQADLARVRAVQQAASGRARITMDANRGYSPQQAIEFASSLDPAGIDLFEQPCEADEWEANAAAARVSTVPIMLDESIRGLDDIKRAATLPNVKFVKLKLKRIGGVDRARAAMRYAREFGLDVCLGDGVATELLCWVEACAGRGLLQRAGDMNGFLKPAARLFRNPLPFRTGEIVMEADYWPEIDLQAVKKHAVRSERFAAVTA
jgi:L-Ala-D/L-Glu epimerase